MWSRVCCWFAALAAASACAATTAGPDVAGPELPRLAQSDLVYVGSFRVPKKDRNKATFEYGGYAPAFNPDRQSLFLVGHKQKQLTAEISIPRLVASDKLRKLKTAKFVQPFSSATNKQLGRINPSNRQSHVIGGQLVRDGQLYVNAYSTYDTRGTQESSLFIRDADLGADDSVSGPYRVGGDAHLTSAYMANVPPEWQASFGGPVLAGNCCRSIITYQSYGPALSVFDPGAGTKRNKFAANMLLEYTANRPLGPGPKSRNEVFNLTSQVDGVVFPGGTSSVLFFGRHGLGDWCYGEASDCGDKAVPYKGNHAYPYVYQVWAYDARDLLAVRKGRKSPSNVEPYDIWILRLPFEKDGSHFIGGTAYDEASRRIYISQLRADSKTLPLIHVFEVKPGAESSVDAR